MKRLAVFLALFLFCTSAVSCSPKFNSSVILEANDLDRLILEYGSVAVEFYEESSETRHSLYLSEDSMGLAFQDEERLFAYLLSNGIFYGYSSRKNPQYYTSTSQSDLNRVNTSKIRERIQGYYPTELDGFEIVSNSDDSIVAEFVYDEATAKEMVGEKAPEDLKEVIKYIVYDPKTKVLQGAGMYSVFKDGSEFSMYDVAYIYGEQTEFVEHLMENVPVSSDSEKE